MWQHMFSMPVMLTVWRRERPAHAFATRSRMELRSILLLVANGSSELHKMYQSRCMAKNSWWRAERLPEICRVVVPIKLEFSASVGFMHKEFSMYATVLVVRPSPYIDGCFWRYRSEFLSNWVITDHVFCLHQIWQNEGTEIKYFSCL